VTAKDDAERRINPARKKEAGVTYLVEQDDGGRWNVTRDKVATGAFARDKSSAVGLAYQAASSEMAETAGRISVWSIQGSKRTKEWPG
jgi:hypothetical protein